MRLGGVCAGTDGGVGDVASYGGGGGWRRSSVIRNLYYCFFVRVRVRYFWMIPSQGDKCPGCTA